MKQLLLIRHAKSSWEGNLDDHKRPLSTRGVNDAHLVSNYLKPHFNTPDLVLCSDATRTQETARIFIENLNIPETIFNLKAELYDFSGQQVMDCIKALPETINCVLVFGHNHAVTSLANFLGDIRIDNVPTCGYIAINFKSSSWQFIANGKTIETCFPKDLKE